MEKKVIVLGADNGYQDKLETTIKSICAHNRGLKFYVFNDDISSEWFQLMSKRLEPLLSEIVNVKISGNSLRAYHLPLPHLAMQHSSLFYSSICKRGKGSLFRFRYYSKRRY